MKEIYLFFNLPQSTVKEATVKNG